MTHTRYRIIQALKTLIYHALVMLLGVVMVYPLVWMIMSSFKPTNTVFTTAGSLIPTVWTIDNYVNGLKGFGGIPFTRFFLNSFFISITATIGTVASSALVAYSFSRLPFRGRGLLFAAMLVTMMLPAQVLMVPQYLWYNKLGWVNSYMPMIVPYFFATQGFFVYLNVNFINGIPRDLDEAARIDGCSWYGIFVYILIPMIIPALVTVGILTFINAWGDFMGSLLYLNEPSMYTVAYALKLFSDSAGTDFGATFAMSVLSLVPILIIFFFFQKQLVEGISTQGLKG